MKVCFIACGPISWASARLRCYWPARYMRDAVVSEWNNTQGHPAADVYVWQKRINPETMKAQRESGARVYLDMCDPGWWWEPGRVREVLPLCDGVVCSNQALRDDLAKFAPGTKVYCIPDRLELSAFPNIRVHAPALPVRFIWYGIANNRVALLNAVTNLERLAANGYAIELTVCDDRPDVPLGFTDGLTVYHTQWKLETENQVIASHDIALLPPFPGAWGKVKSNNKTLTAWACGLPVSTGEEYFALEAMVGNAKTRQMLANSGMATLKSWGDVKLSGADWDSLLCA